MCIIIIIIIIIIINIINIIIKELVITKKDKDFKKSIKCWICDNGYVDGDVKMRENCRITGKYRDSAHRDCNYQFRIKS